MVSIIVPVYNVEQYLGDCIESLINQSYPDIQIILADDGSTDSSPNICDQYSLQDTRIKVIHKENGGQSSARNAGLKLATGQFITFVDSDDWVEPQFCETLVDIIGEEDMAICAHRQVTTRGEQTIGETSYSVTNLDRDALWDEIFGRLNNAVWNKLYKRELLAGIEFPVNMHHGEDLLFNLEYITKCKGAAITSQSLYNYYKHSGSVTTSGFSPRKIFEITTKDAACDFVKLYHPSMLNTAQSYCFRARLNVLRSIYLSYVHHEQNQLVAECKKYLKANYSAIGKSLPMKDRIEYSVVMHLPLLYPLMLKAIK